MTLTQFLDNVWVKIFGKHYGGLKKGLAASWRFLQSVTTLAGWVLPFPGTRKPILVLNSFMVVLSLLGFWLEYLN